METGQKNRNRDIYMLKGCQGMLDEIRMLREKDSSERRALIGSPRFDGMPHGGGESGLEDVWRARRPSTKSGCKPSKPMKPKSPSARKCSSA